MSSNPLRGSTRPENRLLSHPHHAFRPVSDGMHPRSGTSFVEISAGDLDVAVVGQLPATNLPLDDEFEPGPVKMVGFQAHRPGVGD